MGRKRGAPVSPGDSDAEMMQEMVTGSWRGVAPCRGAGRGLRRRTSWALRRSKDCEDLVNRGTGHAGTEVPSDVAGVRSEESVCSYGQGGRCGARTQEPEERRPGSGFGKKLCGLRHPGSTTQVRTIPSPHIPYRWTEKVPSLANGQPDQQPGCVQRKTVHFRSCDEPRKRKQHTERKGGW